MKKRYRWILGVLCVILFLLVLVGFLWRKEIRTVNSITQASDDGTLFSMDYRADYDLDEMGDSHLTSYDALARYFIFRLSHGLVPMSFLQKRNIGANSFGCTSFHVRSDDGDWLFARNFDYNDAAVVMLRSHPKNGYESISFCDAEYGGQDSDSLAGWPWKKIGSLALIYTPMDGMNEKGLAMCILELPHHPAGNDTVKADIATSTLIRLVLDRCATVDEAVALVETLDMFDDPFDTSSKDVVGSAYHYQISDARGKSVVIEYDYENCFTVIPVYKAVDAEWQICTNHYLTEKYSDEGDAISDSWGRYAKVDKELSQGSVTEKGCMDILSDVSVENIYYPEYGDYYSSTQWSVVYNLTDLTASVCMG